MKKIILAFLFSTTILTSYSQTSISELNTNPIKVDYLGGPTVIIEIEGVRFMTDPTLDKQGSIYQMTPTIQLEKTGNPYLEKFPPIDYVLLSHDSHQDNLDTKGRTLLKNVKKVFTSKSASENLKNNSVGLKPWESETIVISKKLEITITATPARHGPAGVTKFTGNVIGFIISVKKNNKEYQIYFTGDTVYYEGIKEVSDRFNPQYIIACAGAVKAMGLLYITMNENDLVDTSFAFPEATIIPVHFEGWAHFSGTISPAKKVFEILGISDKLMILDKENTNHLIIK